jgi:hypothetical protein
MVERLASTLNNPAIAADKQNNLVGQPRRHYDPGGLTELVRLDFRRRGGPPPADESVRQGVDRLADAGRQARDRRVRPGVDDALGRPTLAYAWHRQGAAPRVAINGPTTTNAV